MKEKKSKRTQKKKTKKEHERNTLKEKEEGREGKGQSIGRDSRIEIKVMKDN